MTRTSYRPLAAVGLVVALLAYVGCARDHDDRESGGLPPRETTEATSHPRPADGAALKLFPDWPTPAGALIVSGEQDGYLEPCGCTKGQQGGLIRRFDMVERLRAEKKWPLALIDLGGLIKDPAGSRGGPEQSKIKFTIALKALGAMDYSALALSAEDLKIGVFEALGQFSNMSGPTKVIAANVTAPNFESVLVPSIRAKVGPVAVGVTAVLDPEALKGVRDPDKDTLLAVKPVAESLPAVLADLEKDTHYQVLMVQGPPEEARKLAEAYPGFDVVVGTSQVDPKKDADELNGGKTLLVTVGKKGKFAGVLGFFPGFPRPLRYQTVPLDTRFNGPAKAMKEIVEVEYRGTLKAAKVVENFPRHDYVNAPKGARFVGAEACQGCHPKTFAKWASTGHATAYESLENDPRPDTVYDVECVSCHTTGFEYTSGFKSAELTPALLGNQCENCHGPASKHVADPDDAEARKFLALTTARAKQDRLCLTCHDEDNSPHFDFDKYNPKVAHRGLDTYDDPKVHQGQAPTASRSPAE